MGEGEKASDEGGVEVQAKEHSGSEKEEVEMVRGRGRRW